MGSRGIRLSKDRSRATPRCVDDIQGGGTASPPRSFTGCPLEGEQRLGEGKKQREEQRQGERQGQRERCLQKQGGEQEGLLSGGAADGLVAEAGNETPRKGESSEKITKGRMADLDNVGAVAFANESTRTWATFHPHYEGGAATPPETFACTGAESSSSQLNRDGAISGLGRDVVKNSSSALGAIRVRDVSAWLEGKLDVFLDRLCKTKPLGRIFPLPTSSLYLGQVYPHVPRNHLCMLRALVVSLNSLNGEGVWNECKGTELQKEVLDGLLEDCGRVYAWSEESPPVSWENFFRCRGVDYQGDEVLTAQHMQWENVKGALPDEVGGVALEDVVELGSRHFVLNFEEYLLPVEDQKYVHPPRVMVPPDGWDTFCTELLARGVFDKVHEDDLYRVEGKPLLNGLFGVSKGEFDGPWESMRIIMNLVPVNQVCRSIEGDVGTLPSWAGMTPLSLMPEENLIVSSEDVRCFFYIFKVPKAWHRYMAFNRPLPSALKGEKDGTWFPCSAVLPMGFKNSVALAQQIHRWILKQALGNLSWGAEGELRKDRTFPSCNPLFRVYLDNFDELRKVSRQLADTVEGKVSPLIAGLREEYLRLGVPRHPKKGVASQQVAEVQGAIVDGVAGVAYPKPAKVLKYMQLGRLLLEQHQCTQKQAQVVAGGLVYFSMFRRPLLGCLNSIWKFITSFDGLPPFIKLIIPREVKEEVARFLGLVPLVYMDFRAKVSSQVTASDASEYGGGITVSSGPSPAGCVASQCPVRGDLVEPADLMGVLTIGLFDGIGALRVACDVLGWHVHGHVSVEISPQAQRVVESRFPNTIAVSDVTEITLETVQEWARRFSQVGLVMLGAGPPCQGVSDLNAGRKGAMRDARSHLFVHVSRIRDLLKQCFPWAQVRALMESVASMDNKDEQVMSADFGGQPWQIDAVGVSLARRPRLYWFDWEVKEDEGVAISFQVKGRSEIHLTATVEGGGRLLQSLCPPSPLRGHEIHLDTGLQAYSTAKQMPKPNGSRTDFDSLPISTGTNSVCPIEKVRSGSRPLRSVR